MTKLWTLPRRSLITLAGSVALVGCGSDEADPTEPGTPAPSWQLTDIQPQSVAFGETYGLDAFRGSATLVALLAGGCNTCVGIAYSLDSLLQELVAEGLNVSFCAVNDWADGNPQLLTDVCSFPVFQDEEGTNAWSLHGGDRDDLFIYGTNGALVQFYDLPADPAGNPASNVGRANLRAALISSGA